MKIKKERARIEGLILKVFNYQEQDKILHVFTEEGIKHFIFKGLKQNASLIAPLILAEFIYSPLNPNSNLLPCYDIYPLNYHLFLRKDFLKLKIACLMVQILHESQLPDNPSENLYRLFKEYLKKIEGTPHLFSLFLSFRLKLLKYEGILSLNEFEKKFTLKEKESVELLIFSKNLNEISGLNISSELIKKIETTIFGNDVYCLCHLFFKY